MYFTTPVIKGPFTPSHEILANIKGKALLTQTLSVKGP